MLAQEIVGAARDARARCGQSGDSCCLAYARIQLDEASALIHPHQGLITTRPCLNETFKPINQTVLLAQLQPNNRFIMKLLVFPLSLAAVCAIKITPQNRYGPAFARIHEWCDIWISHANETKLPRVLLIGDSIARDYYPEVERRLAGKAFVARLPHLASSRPRVVQGIELS